MLETGEDLGSFRIVAQIGAGGMGLIYEARHTRIGRRVALKVLKPEVASRPDVGPRFLEEARAVNGIGHPNIVDIVDFVEDTDRDPPLIYTVMELLEGSDLAARIEQAGPLPPALAVAIASPVAEALAAVHAHGIIHRDLKAENIFLCGPPDAPKVKLLDFGTIKAIDPDREMNLTEPGMAVGTPWYMAPEQVLNKPLDQRTDIYSLGVVLYYMCTGGLPFPQKNFGEVLINTARQPPPSFAERGATRVPAALEAVVMRCLEKRPRDRYQSMDELRQALTESLADATPEADEAEGVELDLNALRSRSWLYGLAGLVLVLAVGLSLALWPGDDTSGAVPATRSAADPDADAAPTRPAEGTRVADGSAASLVTRNSDGSTGRSDSAEPARPHRPASKVTRSGAPKTKARQASKGAPSTTKRPAARTGRSKRRPANLTTVDPFN